MAGNKGHTSDVVIPGELSGIKYLKDPKLNMGLSFCIHQRQFIGIHGLLPPKYRCIDEEIEHFMKTLATFEKPIHRYMFMMDLWDRSEKIFFNAIHKYTAELMPLIYTPVVGEACLEYSNIFRRPRGLFISLNDKGNVLKVVENWPQLQVKVIVVTDGERILGLGDLGAHGMPICIGKLGLYTALAGIHPSWCLPITLDVGTNTQRLLDDKDYLGMHKKRPDEKIYDEFLQEFMEAIVNRFGQKTLIQFEDFANYNAVKLLERYKDQYCVFNDDIQGTAGVAVAGLMTSERITLKKSYDYKVLFFGAGSAACGIADLLVTYAMVNGKSKEEARNNIFMVDIDGLIANGRPEKIIGQANWYAKDLPPSKDLSEVVKTVKPNVIIGVSAAGKMFTKEVLQEMAINNERPVVFSLSNPTHKSECTAEEAYTFTDGRAVFASGSPFGVIELNGKTFRPGQGNNAYVFPGVGLGVIAAGLNHIPPHLFLIAAHTLADSVSKEDIEMGSLYPRLNQVKDISISIAVNIMNYSYENCLATTYPEPKDKESYVKSLLYDLKFRDPVPLTYSWN